jgi:hypothetical protein
MSEFEAIVTHAELALTKLLGAPVQVSVQMKPREPAYTWNGKPKRPLDDAQQLLNLVCDEFGLFEDQIKGTNRGGLLSDARRAFCWLAQKHLKLHPHVIGRFISKDRTTVLYAIERAEDLISVKDHLGERIQSIEKSIFNPLNTKHNENRSKK